MMLRGIPRGSGAQPRATRRATTEEERVSDQHDDETTEPVPAADALEQATPVPGQGEEDVPR